MGIKEGVEEFNRHHGMEAHAEIVKINEASATVKMSGHFCHTCGVSDYYEDLRQALEDNGVKAEIPITKESEEGTIVEFAVRKL